MTQEPKKVSRRQAIKLLTATAGAATLASMPNKWVKPILKAGVLPAHAQTSTPVPPNTPTSTSTPTNTPTSVPTNTPTATATNTPTATATPEILQGNLNVDLGWGAEVGQMNLDLEVYDPGSAQWCTPTNALTLTLAHQGDAGLGGSGSEEVDSFAGVVAGTYNVWLRVIETSGAQGFLMFADVDINANGTIESGGIELDVPPANGTLIQVADVDFPSGNITWYIPTFP